MLGTGERPEAITLLYSYQQHRPSAVILQQQNLISSLNISLIESLISSPHSTKGVSVLVWPWFGFAFRRIEAAGMRDRRWIIPLLLIAFCAAVSGAETQQIWSRDIGAAQGAVGAGPAQGKQPSTGLVRHSFTFVSIRI